MYLLCVFQKNKAFFKCKLYLKKALKKVLKNFFVDTLRQIQFFNKYIYV